MATTQKGRARHEALFSFLDRYPMATTDQLATLIWAGDQRLARSHLLRFTRDGLLRRLPHPLYRNGAYVYMARGGRATTHSQKVLHHLQAVDFHVAATKQLGRYGVRVIPELPWGTGVIPDQTVIWRESVWAVEHHLTGEFRHGGDYQRLLEEEALTLCHWWRPGVRTGLLVVTSPGLLDNVRGQIRQHDLTGLTWRVASKDGALRDVAAWVK